MGAILGQVAGTSRAGFDAAVPRHLGTKPDDPDVTKDVARRYRALRRASSTFVVPARESAKGMLRGASSEDEELAVNRKKEKGARCERRQADKNVDALDAVSRRGLGRMRF